MKFINISMVAIMNGNQISKLIICTVACQFMGSVFASYIHLNHCYLPELILLSFGIDTTCEQDGLLLKVFALGVLPAISKL